MIYQFGAGYRIKTSAQTVGEECERLSNEGRLTPKNLVDESRPVDAPLHDEFEWDDAVAAEAYRESQASYIIRSLVVKCEESDEPVRAFHAVQMPDHANEYEPISLVMNDDMKRVKLLQRAYEELAAFRRKYKTLSELSEVFAKIDELISA